MFSRIDRVIVPVRSLQQAVSWYEAEFGFKRIAQRGQEAHLRIHHGETLLSLKEVSPFKPLGHLHREGHVSCFNFYTHWEHLHEAQFKLSGVRLTETADHPHIKVREFYDPFGNVIGLCHERPKSLYYTPYAGIPPAFHRVLAVFIPVLDVNTSIRWYTEVLGMKLANHWKHGADLRVGAGETIVTLIEMDQQVHLKRAYFSLHTPDIEKAHDELRRKLDGTPQRASLGKVEKYKLYSAFDVIDPGGIPMRISEAATVVVN